MAVKLLTVNDRYDCREADYIVDIEDEKNQIPVADQVFGTKVYVIETKKRYRMNSNNEWIEDTISGGGGGGSSLPPVTTDDNGDVLTVVEGEWAKAAVPTELPTVTGDDNGKVLSVANGAWSAENPSTELPAVGPSDKDKYLHTNASTGALEWVVIPSANGEDF